MKPWLLLPPKFAHDIAPMTLQILSAFKEPKVYRWQSREWRGHFFANPLGIAGGVDKDAASVESWWKYGVGFIEVGTITPEPQDPNPGRIIDRDVPNRALWNKMGFPGMGALHARENLRDLPYPRATPVFVNIGKNRTTPNERAAEDYASCIETLAGLADAFVINISSPNTVGLRDLFQPAAFSKFLKDVQQARDAHTDATPLLLKLSPDLNEDDLRMVVDTACDLGIEGFIATNTTLERQKSSPFPNDGGVSGEPLTKRSREVLKHLLEILGSRRAGKLIVSVGGVMDAGEVFKRLEMGADLVQVYSALIFEGPNFFAHVATAAQRAIDLQSR